MSARGQSNSYDVCSAVVSHLPHDARVWKQARSLTRAGYSVHLVGMRYDIASPIRRIVDGVSVTELPLGSRRRSKIRDRIGGLLHLWREILATRARSYHCHNVHPVPAAWLASKLRRVPLVYDAHEIHSGVPHEATLIARASSCSSLAIEHFIVPRSAAVITTNLSRAKALANRHRTAPPVVLQNVPFRVDSVSPLDPGYPQGRRVLLYQGGIYAHTRAFRQAIEALTLLDDFDLVVVGFGRDDDLDLLRGWAQESGVGSRVHLLPPRPFDELVRTASAATVGLVPIRVYDLCTYLGDTNKLFEYLMAGVPVAGSDIPEVRRVLEQGSPQVGAVFDPDSPSQIAEAVERLIGGDYEARRREARRLALTRFNWEIEEIKLTDLYRRLVSPASAGTVGSG